MQFKLIAQNPVDVAADLLVFTTFGDPGKDPLFVQLDKKARGRLSQQAEQERFEGKPGQTLLATASTDSAAPWIAVLGAGARKNLDAFRIKDLATRAARLGRRRGAAAICFVLPAAAGDGVRTLELTVE